MKRDFLEGLGLEKEVIDKILDANSADIGKEKAKADTLKDDLATAQQTIADREKDLETLKKSAGDADGIQAQLDELKAKYDKETSEYQAQIAERDYSGAVARAIADKAIKFSSKAAERAFIADLKANRLEVKDGALVGFGEYLGKVKESDPDSFAPDKPKPSFAPPAGNGGEQGKPLTIAEQLAKNLGAAAAQRDKAANEVISKYTGGN